MSKLKETRIRFLRYMGYLIRAGQIQELRVLFPALSHTSVEIDHELMSADILLPSADSISVVVSYSESMCTKYW